MATTTDNLGLTLYEDNDPNDLRDGYNNSMRILDTTVTEQNAQISNAKETAGEAQDQADNAVTAAGEAQDQANANTASLIALTAETPDKATSLLHSIYANAEAITELKNSGLTGILSEEKIENARPKVRYVNEVANSSAESSQGGCVWSPSGNYSETSPDLYFASAYGTDDARNMDIYSVVTNSKIGSVAMGAGHYGNLTYGNGRVYAIDYTEGTPDYGKMKIYNVTSPTNPVLEKTKTINQTYGLEYYAYYDVNTLIVGHYDGTEKIALSLWQYEDDTYTPYITLAPFRTQIGGGSNIHYDKESNSVTYCGYNPSAAIYYDGKTGTVKKYINLAREYDYVNVGEIESYTPHGDNVWFTGYFSNATRTVSQCTLFYYNAKTGMIGTTLDNALGNSITVNLDVTADIISHTWNNGHPTFKYAMDVNNYLRSINNLTPIHVNLKADYPYVTEFVGITPQIIISTDNDSKFLRTMRLIGTNTVISSNIAPTDTAPLQAGSDNMKYFINAYSSFIAFSGNIEYDHSTAYVIKINGGQAVLSGTIGSINVYSAVVTGTFLKNVDVLSGYVKATYLTGINASSENCQIEGQYVNEDGTTVLTTEQLAAMNVNYRGNMILSVGNTVTVQASIALQTRQVTSFKLVNTYDTTIINRTVTLNDAGQITMETKANDTGTQYTLYRVAYI